MFKLIRSIPKGPQGFVMQFSNGLEASVMFGTNNYCSNQGKTNYSGKSNNAELIVFKTGTNEAIDLTKLGLPDVIVASISSDNVALGWADAEKVASILAAVAALPKP